MRSSTAAWTKRFPFYPQAKPAALCPKPFHLVFLRQQRPSHWLCTPFPLDASQKRRGEITALTFARPDSGLLQPAQMSSAGLPSLCSCNKTLQALSSLRPHFQKYHLPTAQERQRWNHIKLLPLPNLGRSCASSIHTQQNMDSYF